MKKNDELLNALKVFIDTWEDTYSAEEQDEDQTALDDLNIELHDLMELQGFSHWQTGGGCTAWGKFIFGGNDSASPYVMVTTEDASAYFGDLKQPTEKNALMVCFYDANGDWLADGAPIYYSWEEFKNNFKGGF